MREKLLMRVFACSLFEGIVCVVVMAACDFVVLLLERALEHKHLLAEHKHKPGV